MPRTDHFDLLNHPDVYPALDRWLGTTPWGLIGMFFLGAGAGIVNVYRAVNGIGYAPGYRKQPGPESGSEQ